MSNNNNLSIERELDLRPYQVIVKPLVTEKGVHRASHQNQYTFEIHPQATKRQVKHAIEELFNVRVLHVRTQCRAGKSRRYKHREGRTVDWKKAIVKLNKDDRINFF